ncbi:MAG: glycosyltransferase, partial [Gemmataceae bacterium]|nr:glycosyltransferase [Gemmataceae bacterium]
MQRLKRRRVAHVTLGLDVGGQERLLVEFARHTDRVAFDLFMIVLSERGRFANAIEAEGWPVLTLHEPPGLRPKLPCRLAALMRRLHIDVVHTHDDKPLLYGTVASRLAGIRRVIHTHHHGVLPGLSWRRERLIALAGHGVDRFVCVSHDAAGQLAHRGVPRRRLCVVWNGIDLTRFNYTGPQRDGPIVSVARLSPEKDVANLVRAMAVVARVDASARLEIAGDGPCREELLHLTQALGLGGRVRFLGETDDIAGLLARASLFVLPSQTEGISLTVLEAMARGLPVMATRVGGTPEVVV